MSRCGTGAVLTVQLSYLGLYINADLHSGLIGQNFSALLRLHYCEYVNVTWVYYLSSNPRLQFESV